MDLNHLKINFLGDSITSGQRSTQPELCYVGRFQTQYPEAVIRNYGVPGSCISNQCLWGVEDFCARADCMDAALRHIL